jgi:hypothetical protein
MKRLMAALACVIPALTALACGGQVAPVGAGDGGRDEGGGGYDASVCPGVADVHTGAPCDFATQDQCAVPITYAGCDNVAVTGTCSCLPTPAGTAAWLCDGPSPCLPPPPPPPPDLDASACPSAASIVEQAACNVDSQLSCPSDQGVYDCYGTLLGDESCSCLAGQWFCRGFSVPACVDAAPPPGPECPDAGSIEQGDPCSAPSQECPGNPQPCDGVVFYDAFECDNGQWRDVATTHCADDGGVDGG